MNIGNKRIENRRNKLLFFYIIGLSFTTLSNVEPWFPILEKYDLFLSAVGLIIVLYAAIRYSNLFVNHKTDEELELQNADNSISKECEEINKDADTAKDNTKFLIKLFLGILVINLFLIIADLVKFTGDFVRVLYMNI